MNEKINLQNLVDALADKHDISKKNADTFVRGFFSLIEESLEKDKYVKIKGLGTFKLIDVESRESVSVSTGERFEIQGHTKVSFTPDSGLKETINRPFAHFETVVLNENTVLEDTLEEQEEPEENLSEEQVQPTPVKETTVVETTTKDVEETAEKAEEAREKVEEITEKIEEKTEEAEKTVVPVEEKGLETAPVEEHISLPSPVRDNESVKSLVAIVVFVLLLCLGLVVSLCFSNLFDSSPQEVPVQQKEDRKEQVEEKEPLSITDSMDVDNAVEEAPVREGTKADADSIFSKQEIKEPIGGKTEIKNENPINRIPQESVSFKTDSLSCEIVGTQTTYVLQGGETLTRIALKFFGTKSLWPYLVKHNPDVIKNPDNVPAGTAIKIPKLVKKHK